MSDEPVAAETFVALAAEQPRLESYPGRVIAFGDVAVTRVLPVKGRRLIGPWCFLDRFGPLTFAGGRPMAVGAHPNTGLKTVTWLLDGELVHHDSLGSESLLRTGGVNVMTAGSGIAHAEHTPAANTGRLNGARPVRLEIVVKRFDIPSAVMTVIAGGGRGMNADANLVDARTGALIVANPDLGVYLPSGGGIVGTAVQAALDNSAEQSPADKIAARYGENYRDWLLRSGA